MSPLGIPTFQVRVDGSIASRHYHPARLGPPGRRSDRRSEIVPEVEYLRARHEFVPVGGKISREQFMKLRRVDIGETVRCVLYSTRFGEVARKASSVL